SRPAAAVALVDPAREQNRLLDRPVEVGTPERLSLGFFKGLEYAPEAATAAHTILTILTILTSLTSFTSRRNGPCCTHSRIHAFTLCSLKAIDAKSWAWRTPQNASYLTLPGVEVRTLPFLARPVRLCTSLLKHTLLFPKGHSYFISQRASSGPADTTRLAHE